MGLWEKKNYVAVTRCRYVIVYVLYLGSLSSILLVRVKHVTRQFQDERSLGKGRLLA